MKNEQLISRFIAVISVALLAVVVVLGLFATGPDEVQGEYVRLLCVHPGVAWTAYVAFSITTVASLLWLWPKTRKPFYDQIAGASAEIGIVFTFLALATGSIWAKVTWSAWWIWDARTTSTALLLFMYLGVLAIRTIPATAAMRAQRSAFTALIAFVNVPLVHFSVKLWRTQHQGPTLSASGSHRARRAARCHDPVLLRLHRSVLLAAHPALPRRPLGRSTQPTADSARPSPTVEPRPWSPARLEVNHEVRHAQARRRKRTFMSYVIAGYSTVFGTLAVYGAWVVIRGRQAAARVLADEARRAGSKPS